MDIWYKREIEFSKKVSTVRALIKEKPESKKSIDNILEKIGDKAIEEALLIKNDL
jgi:hypothetical protein